MPNPTKTPSGKWVMQIDGPKAWAKISMPKIPGLTYNSNGSVIGRADAVAAACFRLGIEPPPKVSPSVGKAVAGLREYQNEGINKLHKISSVIRGSLLADDMGLGKTVQAINYARLLGGRVLVTAPAFVRETWREELRKWGEVSVAVLGPESTKADAREWADSHTKNWVVTSYDHRMVERAYAVAFPHGPPEVLIMDEFHLLTGRGQDREGTKRSKAVENIAKLCNYRLGTTGTPLWSRPRDLHRLLVILFGTSAFGSSWDFDHAYCGAKIDDHGGLDNKGISNADELALRLSYYMVRREKKDVLKELPSLTIQTHWCDPDTKATQAFRAFIQGGETAFQGSVSAALEATLEGKISVAVELAKNAGRFVLFTHRKDHARRMHLQLLEAGVANECVTGELDTRARQRTIRLAESRGAGVVATIDSCGAGVNMQGVASTGIIHAIPWVPAQLDQAVSRLHRMGQTQPVSWHVVAMKETIDAIVVEKVVARYDHYRKLLGGAGNLAVRDSLSSGIDGAGAEAAEKEALASLFEEFGKLKVTDDREDEI